MVTQKRGHLVLLKKRLPPLFCISVSEMRDVIGFRQQLSTTSFESFELEITVNYPVHTWTENGGFTRNLTSWSVPLWLVRLTEHKVLHWYAPNTVYRCLVARQLYLYCVFSFSRPTASKFRTLVEQFTQQPSCTTLLSQIEIFNQNHIFLWNFHDFV